MASDGFQPLNEELLVEYLKATPSLAAKLGSDFDKLEIKEVGDGNLNFVYIVSGPSGSIVIKQVRLNSVLFFEQLFRSDWEFDDWSSSYLLVDFALECRRFGCNWTEKREVK